MKLAFVNSSYPDMPCGVGDYAANLASAARTAGHEVVVFTSADPRIRVPDRIEVHPVFRDWAIRDFVAHRRRIRRERPDATVLQYPSVLPGPHSRLLFLLPFLARVFLRPARVVLVVHEYAHTHARAKQQLRLAFRFAHEIVTVNPADQRAIAERHRAARPKLRSARIGSNVPRVPLTGERRAELEAEADGPLIFFFGLLHGPDKGLDDLLEAMREIDSARATLLLSGSLDGNVPYHRHVRARIEALGLAGRVRWLGFLAPRELSEWLQAADLVVLPFRAGAAPNRGTLAAALLNGAATVTTRGPETPDYLRDAENVALVPPGDPASLAAAIEGLLRSPEQRERIAEGARGLAPAFEWPAVAEETLGTAAAPPGGEWPAGDLERVTSCPVCGGTERQLLYSGLTDRVTFVAPGSWTLWSCGRCGAAYLDPRPTENTIGRAYRSYHTHGEPAPAHHAPPGRIGRFRWALANGYLNERYGYDFAPASRLGARLAALLPRRRWLADMRVRHLPRSSERPRLLDVGCGNGTFLRDMRDAGWDVSGIDPDPGAVASARATGASVEEGLLTPETFPAGSFDAVTLSHVVEHLPNPAETLAICRDLLRPGGLIWIATPNLESRGHARFGRDWRGLEPPRHLAIYTSGALTGLLERLGFEVVATPRNYMAEFFFRASAAIATGQDPDDASLREPPGLRRSARLANALTVLRGAGAEELIVIARKPDANHAPES
jgi:glycosyltransferase involved in cell wall biosynthesis/SAM-dependent methyltransferase